MTAETSTQRPWAAVARYPDDHDPVKVRAHYAAMVIAHDRAMAADGASRSSIDRHIRPLIAAFTAAALIETDDEEAMTLAEIHDAGAMGGLPIELAWQWLTVAGIDPDTIAPAR